MSILNIHDLSHSFGDKELYRQANLELTRGDHMGVVGQNGAGKSTLLRILLGEIVPAGGQIVWQRGARIGHIDQHADIDGERTVQAYLKSAFSEFYDLEDKLSRLYERMDADVTDGQLALAARWQERLESGGFYSIDSEVARVAEGLGLAAIGVTRVMRTLSGGGRTKVLLGKLLLSAPDVLLLDEPTNFLDTEHIAWLSEYLAAFKGCFMIVSHDFDFLQRITNCICDIEFQTLSKYRGSYLDFVKQKVHKREDYLRQYDAQRREIVRLEDYIARNKVRAATARMARGRQKQLDRMDVMAPPPVLSATNIAFKAAPLTVSTALSVRKLRVGYAYPLLPKLSFSVEGGQKVAVTGMNGVGKTTLLKTLIGELPALGGEYEFAPSVSIGYFEQDMRWPSGEETPLSIVMAAHPELKPKQARSALARLGVRVEHAMRPIRTLSGGEQNKVKLCLLAMRMSNFLILDEPTNHLDAETKQSLREAIARFPGSVLLVCHESAFYEDLVSEVINVKKIEK